MNRRTCTSTYRAAFLMAACLMGVSAIIFHSPASGSAQVVVPPGDATRKSPVVVTPGDATRKTRPADPGSPIVVRPPKGAPQWTPLKAITPENEVKVRREANRTVLDASGSHLIVSLPSKPRVFPNTKAVLEALVARFGGKMTWDAKTGGRASGSTVSIGTGYWIHPHPAPRRIYHVNDPVAAWLGGATGKLTIAGRMVCVDPDKTCTGVPSYLTLAAKPTHDSHVRQCTGGEPNHCVQFHSFMNAFSIFDAFKYARHGANSRFMSGPYQASERLAVCPVSGIPATAEVLRLETVLGTGADDLRDASHAWMQVRTEATAGFMLPSKAGLLPRVSLNNGVGLNNGTRFNARPYPLPPGTRIGHIADIVITHESVQRNPFDMQDNWNLDSIIINAVTDRGTRTIFSQRATNPRHPVHRFSGERPQWGTSITAATAPEEAQLCWRPYPAEQISVEGGALFGNASELGSVGSLDARGIGGIATTAFLPPASGEGVESVETAHWYVGIGATIDSSVAPGVAPEETVYKAIGVCARHYAAGLVGESGQGAHIDEVCGR